MPVLRAPSFIFDRRPSAYKMAMMARHAHDDAGPVADGQRQHFASCYHDNANASSGLVIVVTLTFATGCTADEPNMIFTATAEAPLLHALMKYITAIVILLLFLADDDYAAIR